MQCDEECFWMWHGGRGLFTLISRMVSVSHPSRVALWSMRTVVDDLIIIITVLCTYYTVVLSTPPGLPGLVDR